MSRSKLSLVPCFVAGALLWATAGQTLAQSPNAETGLDADTGIVHITDTAPRGGQVQRTSFGGGAHASCPDGNCRGMRANVYNYDPTCPAPYDYVHRGRCSRKVHQILDWFNPCGMCTFSPDHGWCPPTKRPMPPRQSVGYARQFTNQFAGYQQGQAAAGGNRAPVAYMPTDTTQLGYYYQHVPQWRRNPYMIPQTPHPRDWHVSACCQDGTCGQCQKCRSGHGHAVQGQIIEGGTVIHGTPTQSGEIINQTPIQSVPSTPMESAPAPLETVPEAPADPAVTPPVPSNAGGLEKAEAAPTLRPVRQ